MEQVKQNLNSIQGEKKGLEQEKEQLEEYKTKLLEKNEKLKEFILEAEEQENNKGKNIIQDENPKFKFSYETCPTGVVLENTDGMDRLKDILASIKKVK